METFVSNQSAPSFDQYFELNELKAQLQEKDTVISKLIERIKSLSGNMKMDKVKTDLEDIETINIKLDHRMSKLIAENEHLKHTYKQLYDSTKPTCVRSKEQCDALTNQVNQKYVEIYDLNANLQEQGLIIAALKDELRKLKGKDLVDNKTSKRNVWKPTGKVFTKTGYTWRPTGRTFTIVRNACPLTRITTTTEVPLRKPAALETDAPKPIVTLVYSRKLRKSKTNVPVSKPKIIKSISTNKKEPKNLGDPHTCYIRIGDEIYSIVDACNTASEMWIPIERLQQAQKTQRSNAPAPKQPSSLRSSASTRHKGKEIAKPVTPPSETEFDEDSDPEKAQKDKEMQKNLALIAKYFKKLYKPTNSNLRTSSNSRNKIVYTSLRKPKRVKDYSYHNEKMLLCKQAEKDDLQNKNPSVTETRASPSTISSKPLIKFMKAVDRPTEDKTDKVKTSKKPTLKYAKLYRRKSKSSKVMGNQRNWNNLKSQHLGENFVKKNKACFNYGHFDYLSYDYRLRVKIGIACPKNNNTHKSMPPRAVVHKTVRSPTRTNRSNMNAAQPRRTNFLKRKHSYVRRPFQETTQDLMLILIHRVKMLEKELKVRTSATKVHKVDRGRSRHLMAWVPRRTQPKSTQVKERFMQNNSRVKFKETDVEDHHRNSSFSKKTKSVTVCNNSLNSRTSNVYGVYADCIQFDSGCTKHMTGNLKLLCNFVEKILGTVHFRNDQFAPTLGYRDLIQGNLHVMCEIFRETIYSLSKDVPSSKGRLNLLHMDLYGPMRVASINGKKYIMAEAISTACYNQNKSIIIKTHDKMAYHIINDRKPSIKHLHIFGCTFYITRDGESLDKIKEKGDLYLMVRYSTQSKGYCVYNKRTQLIVESIHAKFNEIKQMASAKNNTSGPVPQRQMTSDYDNSDRALQRQKMSYDTNNSGLIPQAQKVSDYDNSNLVPPRQNVIPLADKTASSQQELEFIFSPLFEEYYTLGNLIESKNIKEEMADSAWIEAM
nr:hypothetical protein [Tanacetum cinerariifolium]